MSSYTKAQRQYEKRHPTEDAEDAEPVLLKCMASGCPMAAGISLGGSKKGLAWCAYHHACHADDLARITSVLNQHPDLRDVICQGRRLLGVEGTDANLLPAEQKRMTELLRFGGYEPPPKAHSFSAWLYQCEVMLGGLVQQAQGVRRKVG